MNRTRPRSAAATPWLVVSLAAALSGCGSKALPGDAPPAALRLVDVFKPAMVSGTARPAGGAAPSERVEWTFAAPDGGTSGFVAGTGVERLVAREGRLVGVSTTDYPLVAVERTSGLDDSDVLHAVEIRARVSAGSNLAVTFDSKEKVDFEEAVKLAKDFPFAMSTPIDAGGDMRTYTLQGRFPTDASDTRHVIIRPTDAAGATFEIESVRLVFRREHLAGIPSGVSWQGLKEIYKETVVARAPETIRVPQRLPGSPRLEFAVGTIEEEPVTFVVGVLPDGSREPERRVFARTITTPSRWEEASVDLAPWAGEKVTLSFALEAGRENAIGFWGAAAVRDVAGREEKAPRGIVLVQCDTLRPDHLDAYGYARPTAPTIARLANEGALFENCVAQATWTKVSSPSILTSTYPLTHGVRDFSDRLPAAAETLAETLRARGFATVSYSSVLFTGKFTNLHQGFETVHEQGSLVSTKASKSAREYVDRLLPWIEERRDVPFFAFLHVFDPHDPYEPHAPFDAMWADPKKKGEHESRSKKVREIIADPLMKRFGMPSRAELEQAGIDPEAYVAHDRDWYDGSIRAMDVEIGRLLERLRELGLEDDTLVVFTSDHGEEFLEHGRTFHGQTAYGELTRVPLVLRWPAGVPAGTRVAAPVESVDIMPTILDLARVAAPRAVQGRSLVPLVRGEAARAKPAFSEKAKTKENFAPPPHDTESYAVVDGGLKLVHHVDRGAAGGPEFELFDAASDPHDLKDLAAERPEEVARLKALLDAWRERAAVARIPPDDVTAGSVSADELERLRALGYVK